MTCKYAQKTGKNTNQQAKWSCIRYLHRRRNPDRSKQQSKGVTLQLLIIQTEADELCKQQHWNSEKIQLKASRGAGGEAGRGQTALAGPVLWYGAQTLLHPIFRLKTMFLIIIHPGRACALLYYSPVLSLFPAIFSL